MTFEAINNDTIAKRLDKTRVDELQLSCSQQNTLAVNRTPWFEKSSLVFGLVTGHTEEQPLTVILVLFTTDFYKFKIQN